MSMKTIEGTNTRTRLVVLQTHPIQYYAPIYSELSKRGVLDLHVLYLTDAGAKPYHDVQFGKEIAWDIPLLEGYSHTFLQPGSEIQGRTFMQRNAPDLIRTLKELSPDWVFIYGYASLMNWRALIWAKQNGIRIVYSSDSNLRNQRWGLKLMAKHLVIRTFFRMIDVALAISETNAAYLSHFGVDVKKLQRMPFAIDVGRFQSGAATIGGRRPYDFIWAGKLIALKRAGDFLDALALVAKRTPRKVAAAIVGDGALQESLRLQARSLPSNCDVHFLGFVNQQSMPETLQRADTLVFSSEGDAYGLIATEAAAAGLALIVAENNGCVGSTMVARPGVNARTYVSGDIGKLADEMSELLNDAGALHKLQAASRTIASEHDLAVAAESIEHALNGANRND
jgi:glycosyltransferase involved in cell wall biosynthesis